jgi:cysteine desulfurase
MTPIYLDHSATTPVRPEVVEAMLPYLRETFGNPGSVHSFGRAARRAVDDARDQVAALINAHPREIVFTSGGTEADNLAILGAVVASNRMRKGIVTTAIEHHAVLDAARNAAEQDNVTLEVIKPDASGVVAPPSVLDAIVDDTAVVSVMHANNETGAIQPIQLIAEACADRGVPFHSDAVQSLGRVPVDVKKTPVSLLAMSAHKIYGPKGTGACYVRKGVEIAARQIGGGQERELRGGTLNVAGIVGFGTACDLARTELEDAAHRLEQIRDRLEEGLLAQIEKCSVNGGTTPRLPHLTNLSVDGVEGESLVLSLDMEGIAVSSGSACTSGSLDPSHVLLAMGQPAEQAQRAVRLSLGRDTTDADIDRVLDVLPRVVDRLRAAMMK